MNCDEITWCSGGRKISLRFLETPLKLFRKVCNFATSTLWLSGISAFSAGGRMASPAAWRLGVSISDCPAVEMTQFSHQFVGPIHLFPNRLKESLGFLWELRHKRNAQLLWHKTYLLNHCHGQLLQPVFTLLGNEALWILVLLFNTTYPQWCYWLHPNQRARHGKLPRDQQTST